MRPATPPSVLAAVALLLGAAAGLRMALPVPAAVALAGAGIALGGGAGALVGGLGAGLAAGAVEAAARGPAVAAPRQDLPAAVTAVRRGGWRRGEAGWVARFRVERFRQGGRVVRWHAEVWVEVPGMAPPRHRRLRLRGYLRRSPGHANLGRRRPGPWRMRVEHPGLVTARGAPPSAGARLADAARRRLGSAAEGEGAGARLTRALLLGESGAIPPAWRRGLARAGLAHLVAVSGLHVALVAAAATTLAAWCPRLVRMTAAAAAVGAYLALVGPRPSLLRASLMAVLALASLLLERTPRAGHLLALVAAGLVLADPALTADLGFRLTVAASAGIVFLGPFLQRSWSGWSDGGGAGTAPARSLAASLGAQIAVLPVALPAFHLLPVITAPANLVAVPWTGLFLLAAFTWCPFALAAPGWGRALLPALDALAAPFAWLAAVPPARLPGLPVASGPAAATALAGVLLWGAARPGRRVPLLALLLLAGGGAGGEAGRSPAARATVIDVGQGDAVLLSGRDGAVLVDGGGWRRGDLGGRVLLPALADLGVGRLRVMVMTHPDRDHCGGLADLAGWLPVGEVWMGPGWRGSPCARDLQSLPGVRLRIVWAGVERWVGGWRLRVLHPPPGRRGDDNERSLVLAARAAGRALLLTGDVGRVAEEELVRSRRGELAADILKVAHHGSRGSSTSEFLAAVGARLAIVSAGRRNVYGHPAPEALARLRQHSRVLRTDRDGRVDLTLAPGRPLSLDLPGSP